DWNFSVSSRSWPAEKARSPAPVMTTARTRGSAFQLFNTSATSARIGVSHALSFHGLLSVTVAMPPVTSVRTARSLLFDMGQLSRVSAALGGEVARPGRGLSTL